MLEIIFPQHFEGFVALSSWLLYSCQLFSVLYLNVDRAKDYQIFEEIL